MSFIKEFKEFAMKGNVMDLAVGVIIGGAFGKIVTSLVDNILMPIVGIFTQGKNFNDYFYILDSSKGDVTTLAEAKAAGAATINYGLFINACVSFFIVSFVVFMLLRSFNKLKETIERGPKNADIPPPADIQLLTEIRDLLRAGART